jgi:fido (protein-threonine AMPylation protein)
VSSTCLGCSEFRSKCPEWRSCKHRRLCARIDVALLTRHSGHPLTFYEDLSRKLTEGHVRAADRIKICALPRTAAEFCSLIRSLHDCVFQGAEPVIAGRFRREGEEAHFGGEGDHSLQGAAHDQITHRLEEAWKFVPADSLSWVTRLHLATQLAFFLEAFFRVHPFVDGNGRVARFVIARIIRGTDRWEWDPTTPRGKDRKRYLAALQQAHRDAPASTNRFKNEDGMPRLLASWLEKRILEPPAEFEAEPEPVGSANRVSEP